MLAKIDRDVAMLWTHFGVHPGGRSPIANGQGAFVFTSGRGQPGVAYNRCRRERIADSKGMVEMSRYCPAGDGVFDDELDLCPECGRELVDEPPLENDPTLGTTPVWLVTAPNEPEAQLWANTLRNAGIPVFVRAGGPGVGAWASVSSFEHDLLVRERDLVKARRIAKELLVTDGVADPELRVRRRAPVVRPVRKSPAGMHRD